MQYTSAKNVIFILNIWNWEIRAIDYVVKAFWNNEIFKISFILHFMISAYKPLPTKSRQSNAEALLISFDVQIISHDFISIWVYRYIYEKNNIYYILPIDETILEIKVTLERKHLLINKNNWWSRNHQNKLTNKLEKLATVLP